MLDALATLVSYFIVTLVPLFSVYKLLKLSRTTGTVNPELLTPWLVFYGTLSVFTFAEATILSPISYILPLYAWFRLLFYAYLLLPAPQGAAYIWTEYIDPFLFDHEDDIERWIATASDEVRVKGGRALEFVIDWFREHVLGQEHAAAVPPPPGYTAYAQGLLSRFYSATPPPRGTVPQAGSTTAFYSAIMSVLQSATTSSTGIGSSTPSRSMPGAIPESVIIPPELTNASPADRLKYIRQAQQGLTALMQAFAREEARDLAESQHLDATAAQSGEKLTKSKSEAEFDTIERDEADGEEKRMHSPTQTGGSAGGWMPWSWSAKQGSEGKKDEGEDIMMDVKSEGKSSGIDL